MAITPPSLPERKQAPQGRDEERKISEKARGLLRLLGLGSRLSLRLSLIARGRGGAITTRPALPGPVALRGLRLGVRRRFRRLGSGVGAFDAHLKCAMHIGMKL